jgi:hypothetical protein
MAFLGRGIGAYPYGWSTIAVLPKFFYKLQLMSAFVNAPFGSRPLIIRHSRQEKVVLRPA